MERRAERAWMLAATVETWLFVAWWWELQAVAGMARITMPKKRDWMCVRRMTLAMYTV